MKRENKICAIILAAGTASRMGQAKQLLPLGDKTILEHVIYRTLQENFTEIFAVIGHDAQRIQRAITVDDSRFNWIWNNDYLAGQSTSLKLAIHQLYKLYTHMMIFLGDLPLITPQTIRTVYDLGAQIANERKESFIVRPTYQGTVGHPVFVGNLHHTLLMQIEGDRGLKSIMGKIPYKQQVAVNDPGIVFDIDTPQDYEHAMNYLE